MSLAREHRLWRPLSTFRRTSDNGKDKATAHPAYRLVRRKASPILKAGAFRRTMCYHALIHGNGYAAIFRNRRFEPESRFSIVASSDRSSSATGLLGVDGQALELHAVLQLGDLVRATMPTALHNRAQRRRAIARRTLGTQRVCVQER